VNRPAIRRISRDSILLISGLTGIGYQQITGKVYIPLLVVFGLMIGLPGVTAILQLLGGTTAPTTGGSSSSSSPHSQSSQSSPQEAET
jgi:hypothetical protein